MLKRFKIGPTVRPKLLVKIRADVAKMTAVIGDGLEAGKIWENIATKLNANNYKRNAKPKFTNNSSCTEDSQPGVRLIEVSVLKWCPLRGS